jgi:hypothetical protein
MRMRRTLTTLAALTLVVGVAACSSDDGDSSAEETLRPADEVAAEGNTEGTLGQPYEQGGVTVVVSSIAKDTSGKGTQGDGTRVAVTMRVENADSDDGAVPDVQLVCAGVDGTGSYYVDSTLDPMAEVPKGSFDEGVVILGQPEAVPATGCADPLVRVEGSDVYDDSYQLVEDVVPVDFTVPPGVLPAAAPASAVTSTPAP